MVTSIERSFVAPVGRWIKRVDERPDVSYPVLAYAMESCVLLVWSDGKHTLLPAGSRFPLYNWVLWEEVEQ